jgi:class 3 adenylate cyclase/CheY-like chemotaxis protein
MRRLLACSRLIVAMTTCTRTLLFTDLVASTELAVGLAERHAHRLREERFGALCRQIDRFRDRLVKNLGDGVMAEFDAARTAIECAVAMQSATANGPSVDRHAQLALRIGISSGDVQLTDGDCFGIPVIEASRLCARARTGQVLVPEATRLLARGYKEPLAHVGELSLKGLAEPVTVWEASWSPDTPGIVRAVLADDAVLVREGIARILERHGIEVLAQASDATELLRLTAELRPDLAIVDVRMPPTHTIEGVDAAVHIRTTHPDTGVLLLSHDVEPAYADRLLATGPVAIGYLLKERVADIGEFAQATRRVAAGGQAFEPTIAPRGERVHP